MPHRQKPAGVTGAYAALVETGSIDDDPAQRALAARLDRLNGELQARQLANKSSSLGWLFGKRKPDILRGIYIHGGVGRGKSMLMDLFFAASPEPARRRVHFNDFMAAAHEQIAAHRRAFAAGKVKDPDPVRPVGLALAAQARLLCFDEFSVTDIADAMLLGRLFAVLFEKGVVVVATSNVRPRDLYRDGLNRMLFIPFIDLIEAHCEVFELDARTDYRMEKVARGQAWLSPLGPRTETAMDAIWAEVAAGKALDDRPIELKGRVLKPGRAAGQAAWFTFDQLCREPRGAADYLAIAKRYRTIFIEGVPVMEAQMRNEAKRLILLIDTLYDAVARTVVSAQAMPALLYEGTTGTEAFEFQRTVSRLMEMQSEEYLRRSLDADRVRNEA